MTPTRPTPNPRQRRHSTATMHEARQMAAGGWTPTEIARYFTRRGTPVHRNTIDRWVNESVAEQQRERQTAWYERKTAGKIGKPTGTTPAYRQARLEALRSAGLSMAAVAKVMKLDFDMDLTIWDVNRMLPRELQFPSTPKEQQSIEDAEAA